MSFSVASCCMFCPPVSYAFATLACWPIAIAPSSCSAAVPICRPWLCHPPALPGWLIVANTATAAPCAGWRSSLPSSFPLGCPTHLSPRTLHDHPLPARSPPTLSPPHSRWGQVRTVATPSIHHRILSPMLLRLPYPKHPSSPLQPVNYLRLWFTPIYCLAFPQNTTSEPQSKHIITTGGFAQPILSPAFRPEAVWPRAE